jgi:uncharacterized protein YbjT (DUF2867 family)
MGASGNTGKPLAMALLKAGKKVRVLSRTEDKVKELKSQGAEVMVGESSDVNYLTKAFTGATAVYAMIPPNFAATDFTDYQKKFADAVAEAVKKCNVKYVVSLSSVGTHLEEHSGVVFGLRYMEQKLDAISGLNTLHLRPTYFMENTLGQVGVIKQMGVMGSPVKADLKLSMIATKDIADYAFKRLNSLNFSGKNVQYLLGQRDLTYNEVASVFGKAIGKPDLKYNEFPAAAFKQALMLMGTSENLADNMNRFIDHLNKGKVLEDAKRDAESTTPTSIEEFAHTFAYVYNM